MRYTVLFSAASLLIAGCSILENDVERGYERNILGSNPVVFTTADIRLITQRRHPIAGNEILCAEPSPDVAKALSAALQLSGQINQASGASGGGAFSGAAAEAFGELAGRSTALLGLRDGLASTCQAYANGSIGDAAYALELSRYGQLMTTLFLGQDIATAA